MTAEEAEQALRSKRALLEAREQALADAAAERAHRQRLLDHAQRMVETEQQKIAGLRAEIEMLEAGDVSATQPTMREATRSSLRLARVRLGVRQEDVAEAMNALGFPWRRLTVTEVESGKRHVSLDELMMLALIFDRPAISFLMPESASRIVLERANGEPCHTMNRRVALTLLAGDGDASGHWWSEQPIRIDDELRNHLSAASRTLGTYDEVFGTDDAKRGS
jgi:transcriptional regulator with XRE-family HTH domain